MNKFSKIIAVTIVTALFISLFCFPSYASTTVYDSYNYWNSPYFMPSPQFPNMESLPYGTDTLIYELMRYDTFTGKDGVQVNGYTITRFYVKRDLYNGNGVSAFNGATFCFSGNNSNALDGFCASTSPVYYQTYFILMYNDNLHSYVFNDVETAPYYKTKDGLSYNFSVVTGTTNNTPTYGKYLTAVRGNYPALYGGRGLKALVESREILKAPSDERPAYTDKFYDVSVMKSYPTSSDLNGIQNDKNNNIMQSKVDNMNTNIINGFNSVNEAITNAVSNAVGGIVNAGSDKPTLDTNNDWMNDSLTKVNQWVSSIDSFKEEMNKAKEDNAQNMEQAGNFLSGFFNVLPTGILAVLSLVLVIIVVVKVIGR